MNTDQINIPKNKLGHTNEMLSIIGIGGYHMGVTESEKTAIDIMHKAIDAGVNFFDNAWEYNKGKSEEIMGKALQGSYRKKAFLMTKVCGRNYQDARLHIEDSLRRLNTETIDLLQFHAVEAHNDPSRIMDTENGAIKAVLEARQQGKIRYIGFSGHAYPEKHLEMINQDFQWDAVQMPLNVMDAHYRSFEHQVLPVCNQKNIGVLGMKSLGGADARILKNTSIDATSLRKYALSLPITTLICGVKTHQELDHILEVTNNFEPLSETEKNNLLESSKPYSKEGKSELYKTTDYSCAWD
ncbi:aldo/keto reductase [Candidatus Peregrinibacteria bacterium]|nr:aldo/keto reductase [Candidatus Peregrinibacteria bacterium]